MGSRTSYKMILVIFAVVLLHPASRFAVGVIQCSKQEYQQCVALADPLLKDPHLIYPDNLQDIDRVCRTWTQFVNCVKRYTDRCFSDIRKQEFNKAVETPIDSVHQLCTDSNYQKEYLKHSACMKSTLTEDAHCGRHYKYLVSKVSGEASRTSICCAHHRFRDCVLDQTKTSCAPDAAPFSRQILDKALSFLKEQCSTYQPSKEDCPGSEFYDATGRTDGAPADFIASQRYPSTPGQTTPDYSWHKPQPYPSTTDTRVPGSGQTSQGPGWSTSWVPGRGRTPTQTDSPTSETYPDGSTRSSFGRGMTWGQTQPTDTAGPTTPWRMPATPQSPPWYPTRPPSTNIDEQMMKENTIDEPNQQGLGSRGAAQNTVHSLPTTALLVIIACFFGHLLAT